MRPEDVHRRQRRPYTGAEYIRACAMDARFISMASGLPTSHASAFRTRSLDRPLYDALHDPSGTMPDVPDRYRVGGYTHKFFRCTVPRDLIGGRARSRNGLAFYGWMGRTPTTSGHTNTLGANAEYYGPYAGNARAWYKRAQETVPFMNHRSSNPPVDRHKPPKKPKTSLSACRRSRWRHHRLGCQGRSTSRR